MKLRHEEEDYADNLSASAPGKIKVVCHGCGARYQVRDSKVRGHRFRATCKRCGGIIVARCDNAFTVLPDQGRPAPRPTRPGALRLGGEDLQQQEDEPVWYVAIAGKPHGPLTPIQVRKSFHAKRINGKTYLWRAGDPDWRRLVDMPEFSDLFGEAPTGFYDAPSAEDDALDGTGETHAGGPMGLRRQREAQPDDDSQRDHFGAAGTVDPDQHRVIAPSPSDPLDDYADESAGGQTAVRHPEDPGYEDLGLEGSEADSTHLHERGRERWEAQPPQQQPLWDLPAAVPRRRAVLPSPTGSPRRFDPQLAAPPPPPSFAAAEPEPPPDRTRPLNEEERIEVRAGPPPELPFPKPGQPTAPPAVPAVAPASFAAPPSLAPPPSSSFLPDLPLPPPPPPARPFEDVLKPVGPQPMLPPLRPEEVEEEGFWTAGKIAAAAAIAGGLAVALTVVLVVAVMRPKTRVVDGSAARATAVAKKEQPAPPPAKSEPKISVVAPKEEPKPEPKPEPKEEPKAEAKAEPKVEAKAEPKPAPKPEPKKVAVAKVTPEEPDEPAPKKAPAVTRTKLKKKAAAPVAARPAKRSEKVDVDDLLAGAAAASKKEPKAPKKKAPSDDSAADDVLAAGSQRKPAAALPVKPSGEQIKAALRPVMGRVQACYDKFQQAGLVRLRITLRPDGSHSSGVVSSTAGAETASCVMGAVRGARFPRFSGPEYSFAYPFELK
jgi:hypothetical protein